MISREKLFWLGISVILIGVVGWKLQSAWHSPPKYISETDFKSFQKAPKKSMSYVHIDSLQTSISETTYEVKSQIHISVPVSNLEYHWQLPEGVSIIEGEESASVRDLEASSTLESTILVSAPPDSEVQLVVKSRYNGFPIGNVSFIKLKQTLVEKAEFSSQSAKPSAQIRQ